MFITDVEIKKHMQILLHAVVFIDDNIYSN